jgi:bla regulator protein BlaR1
MNLQNLESAFTLIWQVSLRACVLIVAVLIVQILAGKRLPARFHYALSLLVFLRLLVPVTPASSWSVFNLARSVRPAPAVAPILASRVSAAVMVAPHLIQSPVIISRTPRLALGQWAAVLWLCGGAGFLIVVFWRHRRFARWVAQLPTATDPRLIELVEQCKIEAGLRGAFRIASAPARYSAAVFGFFRPCLLLPEGLLDTLEPREARLVLLHELVHIRRRDVLVNWISIVALALHWFNPLAWVALRRLRADQELACDAEVLGLIKPAERGAYGRTLLKHLPDFPATRMAAGLVPLITSRHNIKRRIIMITEFKNTGGVARGVFAALLIALGGLTFTRAADDPQPAAPTSGLPATVAATASFQSAGPSLPGSTSAAPSSLGHSDASFQAGMTALPDNLSATPPSKSGQDYGAEYMKQFTLLEQLKLMDGDNHSQFIQALSATGSDPILNALIQQENAQETRLAGIKTSYGPETFQMQEAIAAVNDLKQKIEQRAKGIMAGMSLQVASLKAAANDGLRRGPASDYTLSKRLEDWDHQRVIAEMDYIEYSNILFNLNTIDPKQLGKSLTAAFAHEADQELMDLAGRQETAKASMTAVSQNYGPEMAIYKTAVKQLEESQAAYQNKVDAIMAGIKTRVSQDKGFLQLIEKEERAIEENLRKHQDERLY